MCRIAVVYFVSILVLTNLAVWSWLHGKALHFLLAITVGLFVEDAVQSTCCYSVGVRSYSGAELAGTGEFWEWRRLCHWNTQSHITYFLYILHVPFDILLVLSDLK